MKLLKSKITLDKRGGSTKYKYPADYNADIISPIAYGGTFRVGDDFYTYTIGFVRDDEFDQFVGKENIEEISKVDAEALANGWVDSESENAEEIVSKKNNFKKKLDEVID